MISHHIICAEALAPTKATVIGAGATREWTWGYKTTDCSGSFLGLEFSEAINFNELNEGVEFLLSILILVSLSGDSDSDFARDVSDAGSPNLSIEKGIDAYFLYMTKTSRLHSVNPIGVSYNKLPRTSIKSHYTYPGVHLLQSELSDVLDSGRSSLLELDTLKSLV